MIRTLLLSLTISLLVLAAGMARPAYAAFNLFEQPRGGASDSAVCDEKANRSGQTASNNKIYGPNGILTKVVNLLSILIGIVAVIVIIIAGIRFVISGGDATKVATAKSTILFAVVGLVVAAMAQAMIVFVLNRL